MSTSRTILRPKVNEPVNVILDTPNGIEKTGQFGTDYYYSCNQNQVALYLKPEAHAALQALQPQPGEEIRILGLKKGKDIAWSVTFVSDAAELPAAVPQVSYARGVKFPARVFAQPETAPQPQRRVEAGPKPVTSEASRTTAPAASNVTDLLSRLFVTAAHSLAKAHEQLKQEGYSLEPPIWEDIRACGLSLFIEHNRREQR